MRLSIVIPLFNEEASLRPLFQAIKKTADEVGPYEVIFVDDGSTDGSWKEIELLTAQYPAQVRALRLRRNFGKAAALAAGFRHAQGEVIFTMDGDLQDDPAEIPNFLKRLDEGYDLVSGWKKVRNDPVIHKTLPSRLFNLVTRWLTGVRLHDFNCGFKAYRREVVQDMPLYGELHRFIPVFAHAEGFRVGEMPVHHHARRFGKSKYGWYRSVKGCMDLLSVSAMTRFGQRPGHLFGGLGVIFGAVGFFTLLYLWVNQLMGHYIEGRPLFFFGIMCVILAAQMLCTGVLAELFLRQSHPGRARIPPIAQKRGFGN